MPASTRIHARTTLRPYDRHCSPTPPSLLYPSPPPASPVLDTLEPPDHPGLPTYAEYRRIEAAYLHSLSPRKRDKALITQVMFDKIWDVLHQPDACTIETPQFRFWVRKMFTLSRPTPPPDTAHGQGREEEEEDLELERAMGIARPDADAALLEAVVLHENRPVAIMEQLYELFCYCHVRAGHGGRDKTCAVIRQHYSWVPKELTAQFVKACPTCAAKRNGGAGVEMGIVVQRRTSRGRERKNTAVLRAAPANGMPVGPSFVAWPMTGGPLDPANPQPCGVRDRLRVRETTVPASPERLEWNSMLTRVDAPLSPFHPYSTHSLGASNTGYSPRSFQFEPKGTRMTSSSPGSITERLPSLASALSNESLDDNLNLRGLGSSDALHHESEGGECLPPALRPLRLSGPVPSNITGEPDSEDADLFQCQIDPVLLSGAGLPVGHGAHMHTGPLGIPLDRPGLVLGRASPVSSEHGYSFHDYDQDRTETHVSPSRKTLPLSNSTTSAYSGSPGARPRLGGGSNLYRNNAVHGMLTPWDTNQCATESRFCGPGYPNLARGEDGLLATMRLPCSTDEDGTLS